MVDIICKHGKYFKAYDYKAINSYEGKNFNDINANSIFDKKYLYYGQSLKWLIVQFFD